MSCCKTRQPVTFPGDSPSLFPPHAYSLDWQEHNKLIVYIITKQQHHKIVGNHEYNYLHTFQCLCSKGESTGSRCSQTMNYLGAVLSIAWIRTYIHMEREIFMLKYVLTFQ